MTVFEHSAHCDVGGIGGGHPGFGHGIGRANLAFEEGFQPFRFLGIGAESLEDLHIAGVGRTAVEAFCGDVCTAGFLCDVGVFDGGQTRAAITVRQPEIPKALLAGLGFESFENFGLARCLVPTIPLFHLGQKLLVNGQDLVFDE